MTQPTLEEKHYNLIMFNLNPVDRKIIQNHITQAIDSARLKSNEQGFYGACGIVGVELYAVPDLYKKYRDALAKRARKYQPSLKGRGKIR
jgi:hypothetical protein